MEENGLAMRVSFAAALKEDMLRLGFSYTDVHVDKPEWMRNLLIAYGQARRAHDPDYWIDRLAGLVNKIKHEYPEVHTIVIDDVRFPNEVE